MRYKTEKTQWPFGGGTANKKYEEVFELLEDFDDFNCIMGASASEPAGGGEAIAGHSETRGHEGIVYGHAYSLLQAEDDICGTGIDLVQLRNPWGSGEMTGAWSDHSPLWDKYPQVRDYCGHVAQDDGTFWISKEDFFAKFDTIEVCLSAEATAARQKVRDSAAAVSAERARAFAVLPQHGMDAQFTEWRFMSPDEAMELVSGHPNKYSGYIIQQGNDQGVFVCSAGGQVVGPEHGVPVEWTLHMLSAGEERQAKRQRSKRPQGVKKTFHAPNSAWGGLGMLSISPRKLGGGSKLPLPTIPSARKSLGIPNARMAPRNLNDWLAGGRSEQVTVRRHADGSYQGVPAALPTLHVVVHDDRKAGRRQRETRQQMQSRTTTANK